ncbi:MAG: amine dehydrogenase large subunit [Halieaceae bacterium]|nr:amine dehydrogenase large subunit [Halieaceae bacterium]
MTYFPSFVGLMHPVNVSGDVVRVGKAWHLVPESERGQKWAPGGIGLIDRDEQGRLYLLMHPGAADGTQGNGGSEVWVFNPKTQQRVQRISLREWGLSLGVSRGHNPLLMIVNPINMTLEVYKADSGEFIRTISDFGQETPLLIRGSH